MTPHLALIGVSALYLLFIWLGSAIAASWLSDRAGYGERLGLATGIALSALALPIWLVVYLAAPRPDSLRALDGVLPKRRKAGPIDLSTRPRP